MSCLLIYVYFFVCFFCLFVTDPSQQNNSVITAKAATVQSTDKVVVKRLTGGITNVLFQATYFHYPTYVPSAPAPVPLNNSTTTADDDTNSTNTATSSYAASTASTVVDDEDTLTRPQEFVFLVRAYGNGTDTIIDRDREFATHQHLHSKNLAPQLYARFGNGLVYAYLPGRAVHYTLLSDDDVAVAIARRLAEWHDLLDAKAIDNHIALLKGPGKSFVRSFWELLDGWIAAMPENVIKTHTKEEMNKELQWIKQEIGQMGGPMVVAHCDLLAGNVIVPTDWEPRKKTTSDNQNDISDLDVSFIDYEYAMNSPRAFDIANHFMEWQGFDCKKELIPVPEETNPVLRTWARDYLSYFSSSSEDISEVDTLVKQVLTWWGMPGFYWGIWSSIQSTISDIEFDYANYANERLAEYWEWKKRYLNKHS